MLRNRKEINLTFGGNYRCLDSRRESCAYGTYVRDEATKKTNTWNPAPEGWRSFGCFSRRFARYICTICASQNSMKINPKFQPANIKVIFLRLLRKIASKSFNAALDFATAALYPIMKNRIFRELEEDFRSFGVEDTNVCNARCSFCAYRLGYDTRPKGFVEEKVLKYSLDLFKKWGGSSSFSFISILGDPLTDKDIIKKIKLIASGPLIKEINIYTNLIGLADYDIDEFVKSGVNIMSISTCFGGREMYKRLFGADEYDNVTSSLLKLLEVNKKHGNPINITFLIRMDYPAGKHFDKDLLKKIMEYLPESKLDILPDNMWDDYNGKVKKDEIPIGGIFRKNIKDKSSPCYALYRKMQVLMNGDIAVCSCRVSPELITDNIFNYNDLMDYWRGDKLKKFRSDWINGKIPGVCRGCTHYMPVCSTEKLLLRGKLKDCIKNFLPFR